MTILYNANGDPIPKIQTHPDEKQAEYDLMKKRAQHSILRSGSLWMQSEIAAGFAPDLYLTAFDQVIAELIASVAFNTIPAKHHKYFTDKLISNLEIRIPQIIICYKDGVAKSNLPKLVPDNVVI